MMLAPLFTSWAWFAPSPHPPSFMQPHAPTFAPLFAFLFARAFAERGSPRTLAR